MPGFRSIIILTLLAAALVTLSLTIIAWRRRASAGAAAAWLSTSLAAVTIYNFGYALEVSSNTLPEIMAWVRFENFGLHLVAPAWLMFSLHITGRSSLITPRRVGLRPLSADRQPFL